MHKKTLYIFSGLLIVTIMTIMSCASMGSRVAVIQPESLTNVKCIALSEPVLRQTNDKILSEVTDELWHINARHRLLYAIKEHGLIDKICNDSLREILENITLEQDDPDLYLKAMQIDKANASAILKTELEIKVGDNHKGDSKILMRLHDIETDDIILEIKFNTRWGVAYVSKPTVIMTIRDGISGAVQTLAKSLNKSM